MFAAEDEPDFVHPEYVGDYPSYTFAERVADGIVHVLGVAVSLFAAGWLAGAGLLGPGNGLTNAIALYAATVVLLFVCSAFYHMTPWPFLRPLLRRFDQSAIFFKIAGTYTPLVAMIGTTFSYSILVIVWISALIGAGFKLFTGDRLDRYTVVIYLGLSWASVTLIWALFSAMPSLAVWLIVLGGVVYTVGVYFHQSDQIRYNNAIWHGFVLMASALHFFAIAYAAHDVLYA